MPSHEHNDVARETDPYSPSRSIARGRHRAPQLTADMDMPASGGRYTSWTSGWTATRTTLAAVTTGTLAVGSVALAGCAPAAHSTAGNDTSSINPASAPLAVTPATDALYSGQTDKTLALAVDAPVTERASTGLLVGPGTMIAKPNAPTDMHVLLVDSHTHKGVANARVRILREVATHKWYTTRILTTDGNGLANYTAKVLTTTKLTAVFDGTDTYTSSHANVNTIDMYVPPKPKPAPAPVVTALTVTTPATTSASSGAALQVTAPVATAPSSGSLGAKAVWLASQQAGKPYVWGGNGPYNFDCSGLTKYVYAQLGITLPRTAEEQYEATTRVSQADKQVGDLIFFGTPGSIYHVGIYAGNNQIWNAPNSGSSVSLMTIWDSSYTVGRV